MRTFLIADPAAEYWRVLPAISLNGIESLSARGRRDQLTLLIYAIFYADHDSALAAKGLAMLDACVAEITGKLENLEHTEEILFDICAPFLIGENKHLSLRNSRIPASPRHPVVGLLERQLQDLHARLRARRPHQTLQCTVTIALPVRNEHLFRHYHQRLRDEFRQEAVKNPVDAGLALTRVIKYCRSSQSSDQQYRTGLCRETFDLLLPILQGISPADADVARAGEKWDPMAYYRGEI